MQQDAQPDAASRTEFMQAAGARTAARSSKADVTGSGRVLISSKCVFASSTAAHYLPSWVGMDLGTTKETELPQSLGC